MSVWSITSMSVASQRATLDGQGSWGHTSESGGLCNGEVKQRCVMPPVNLVWPGKEGEGAVWAEVAAVNMIFSSLFCFSMGVFVPLCKLLTWACVVLSERNFCGKCGSLCIHLYTQPYKYRWCSLNCTGLMQHCWARLLTTPRLLKSAIGSVAFWLPSYSAAVFLWGL